MSSPNIAQAAKSSGGRTVLQPQEAEREQATVQRRESRERSTPIDCGKQKYSLSSGTLPLAW
ncbi:MAG: hypothetical protein ACK5TX_04595 [Planctomyces sp.]|jgi:hypothetical protein|nr:hypothetical protein LBMAG46_03270 [Planctomycetia bacterium]